jgi:SAM-dependent methyltransferase
LRDMPPVAQYDSRQPAWTLRRPSSTNQTAVVDDERDCCVDRWAARNAKRARQQEVVSPVSRRLLDAIDALGLHGRSVLDVGCGTGDVALAALARGADRATGIDLGTGAIDDARRLSEERSLADRATFSVGDGATTPLQRHDVVVLNRVYCCYPNVDGLLSNSLPAARLVYAFTVPVSRGLAGVFNRVQIGLENAWYRLRDKKFKGFRVFLHDVDEIDRRVREVGFRRVTARRVRFDWHLAVYERAVA